MNSLLTKLKADEKEPEDWRIGFMQYRFIKLYEILNENIDPDLRNKIFKSLGRECAGQYEDHYAKYAGNVKGMMDNLKEQWLEYYDYDEKSMTLTMIGKPTGECGCPFIGKNTMDADFCECTIGHQQKMFETIFQTDVEASVVESVLRGSDRCSFRVKVKKV